MSDLFSNLLNFPHLHLLFNHFPTVGMVVGVGLLLLSFARRNEHLKKASLEVVFAIAIIALPAYITGMAAVLSLQDRPEVSQAAIDAHHNAALKGFILMELAGAVSWLAIWQSRRRGVLPGGTVAAALVLSVLTVAVMGQAASIGGEIRHPEIVVVPAPPAEGGLLTAAGIRNAVTDYPWIWPTAESVHFLGMCLALGVLLTVNLRLLGAMKGLSFPALHRFLPWGLMGFGVNLITGMLFFIAAAEQYTNNPIFYWKVVFMALAGLNFFYLTVFSGIWNVKAGQDARPLDKLVALSSIASWVGVIYFGRMLPFLGNAF